MTRYFNESSETSNATENVANAEEKVYSIGKKEIGKFKKYNNSDKTGGKDKNRHSKKKKKLVGVDQYPGKAPIDPTALERHSRGDGVRPEKIKTKYGQKMAQRREEMARSVEETAARAEILLEEDAGYLETGRTEEEVEEFTARVTQTLLKRNVDTESARKGFELNLSQFGPYTLDYTRNGRGLVLGGRKGHIAALDWVDKNLKCEINVQEAVHDVKWLHTETMFAVAQNRWTYIYDNQGIELHCLKKVDNVLKMEFLPYHFILAAANEHGYLTWLDVSVGQIIAQFNSRMGRLPILSQNPTNAVIATGHSKGTVAMWTPNVKDEPVLKILAHRQPLTSITFERSGTYMATASMDRSLRIWDIRNSHKCLKEFILPGGAAGNIQFSDRKVLGAIVGGDVVEFYKDVCIKNPEHPYMKHKVHRKITDIHFAPFEDVVGIGHAGGFSSILVPGCGEPNFDALEANPYQTKKQRREGEVKALLEKVPAELISLNQDQIAEIDVDALEEKIAERNKMLSLKPSQIDFEPRTKSKGKKGTAKMFHIKRTVKEEERRRRIKELAAGNNKEGREGKKKKPKQVSNNVLSRL